MNLRWYLLVRKNHRCINFCYLFSVWDILWIVFKFLTGIFAVVLIRNFFPDWEPKLLKQLGSLRYFSGIGWNWCKHESTLGIKNLHRINFFNWVKIKWETENPTILKRSSRLMTSHHPVKFSGNRLRKINVKWSSFVTWPHVTAWSEGYVTLLLDMWLLTISHSSIKSDSYRLSENEFITLFICYIKNIRELYDFIWTGYVT